MSTQLCRSIEYLDTTIGQLQALLAELEEFTVHVPRIEPVPVEVAVLARPEAVQTHEPIEIKMKAGKGYGWLSAAINKAMAGTEGYSDLNGSELRKRMGSQMLYRNTVYRFEVEDLISGAALSGGMSDAQIKRAQNAAIQFKEDRAAKKTEAEIAERLETEKASTSMALESTPVEAEAGIAAEDSVEAERIDLLEVAADTTTVASALITGAALVEHGGKTLKAVTEHVPSAGMNALSTGVGAASMGFGAMEIADGLQETDTVEGVEKVLMGSLSVVGGAASSGMLGPASPVVAAGATTAQVAYKVTSHGDDHVKELGWLTDDQGRAESATEQHLRHMVETEEAMTDLGAPAVVAQAAAYTRGGAELLFYGGVSVTAAGADVAERAVDKSSEVLEDTGEAIEEAWNDAGDLFEGGLTNLGIRL
jgi:hypothetical protein